MVKRFLDFVEFDSIVELRNTYTISQIDCMVWNWAVEDGIPCNIAEMVFNILVN